MRRTASFVAGAALASLALAGCAEASSPGGATTSSAGTAAYPRLTPACPRATSTGKPPVVTVAQLNRIVAGLDLPLWQAGDIGASARLPDDRIVWVFGDTVRRRRHHATDRRELDARHQRAVHLPGRGVAARVR